MDACHIVSVSGVRGVNVLSRLSLRLLNLRRFIFMMEGMLQRDELGHILMTVDLERLGSNCANRNENNERAASE